MDKHYAPVNQTDRDTETYGENTDPDVRWQS